MQGKHLRRLSCPSLSGQDLQQAHIIAGEKNSILTLYKCEYSRTPVTRTRITRTPLLTRSLNSLGFDPTFQSFLLG